MAVEARGDAGSAATDADRRLANGMDARTGAASGTDAGEQSTTHFGSRTVPSAEKATLVRGVFDSVAKRYDLMNDLMSFGLHRLMKRATLDEAAVRPGQRVLDIAGGTGDLALGFSKRVGQAGLVVLSDINAAMLGEGRTRLIDAGAVGNVEYALADAEMLPFADASFDCVTIAFGLRNVTDKARALDSMYRVLKPGGRLLILEFSKPVLPLVERAYGAWSGAVWPAMGKLIANDADSYRYLVESIRMHPDQDTLETMMQTAGFERTRYRNFTGGVAALHKGFRLQ